MLSKVKRSFKLMKPLFDQKIYRNPVKTIKTLNSIQSRNFTKISKKTVKTLKNNFSQSPITPLQEKTSKIRNIAIIAHVDHGKTTMIDCLIKCLGHELDSERLMDKQQLEKEKGITISSKITSLKYKGYTINIVDTPGHQDFGGEVERVLSMVDGVLLLVCGSEGTKRQTRYVLEKAILNKLKPIVVVNKVDRDSTDIEKVEDSVINLICDMDVSEDYLEYKTLYSSAKQGWVINDIEDLGKKIKYKDMTFVLDQIIEEFECPKFEENEKDFSLLVSQVDRDKHFGKIIMGKVISGVAKVNDIFKIQNQKGEVIGEGKIARLIKKRGVEDYEIDEAIQGDLVGINGFENASLTDIITSSSEKIYIECPKIDPPLISVDILPNNSPFAGGDPSNKIALYAIKKRIEEEVERDGALNFEEGTGNTIRLFARGDLHISILLEKMRREGYELQATSPTILYKTINGKKYEPIELVKVQVQFDKVSQIMDKIMKRLGNIIENININEEYQLIEADIPSRGLLGFQMEVMAETKNDAKITTEFLEYQKHRGPLDLKPKNMLISSATGKVTTYGMKDLEKFGSFFVKPGNEVYKGQILGISRDFEMEINPCKMKRMTNIRAAGVDETIRLSPPKLFTIEEALGFIGGEEYLELVPNQIRLRKIELDSTLRKKYRKQSKNY